MPQARLVSDPLEKPQVKTVVVYSGPAGPAGPQGPPGPQGEPGPSGTAEFPDITQGLLGNPESIVAPADLVTIGGGLEFSSDFDDGTASPSTWIVKDTTELANVPATADRVFMDVYHPIDSGKGANGGGMLARDPSDTTSPANDASVFIIGTSRFRRVKGSAQTLLASEAGLYNHATDDQSQRFQDYIRICFAEDWAAEIDVGRINCDGADIWFNTEGDPWAKTSSTFTMRGDARRDTQILNCYATFGKFYRSTGGATDITREPSSMYLIERLHITGVTRFVNIEGSGVIRDCTFFATDTSGFYNAPPTTWGIGNADTRTITTPYAGLTHIVELFACNHGQFFWNNIQNGRQYGLSLGGMLMSQAGNILIVGGRTVTCFSGDEFATHPVYGITSTQKAEIRGRHYESNVRQAINSAACVQIDIAAHVRGSKGVWDTAYPLISVSGALGRDIAIRKSQINGYTTIAGVGVDVQSVQGFKEGGNQYQRLLTAVNIGNGVVDYEFEPSDLQQVNGPTAYVISQSAIPRRLHSKLPAVATALSLAQDFFAQDDHFSQASIEPRWVLRHGLTGATTPSDFAIAEEPGGVVTATTGTSGSGTLDKNGVAIYDPTRVWRAAKKELSAIFVPRAGPAISACTLFIGFIDTVPAPGAIVIPFSNVSGVITANVSNACGLFYDSAFGPNWQLVGVAGGTLVTQPTTYTPDNNLFATFRIDVDETGALYAYRNRDKFGNTELVANGGFDDQSGWNAAANWTIVNSVTDGDITIEIDAAQHTPGSTAPLTQAIAGLVAGQKYLLNYRISNRTAGTITPALEGGTEVLGTVVSGNNAYAYMFTALSGNNQLAFIPSSTFSGWVRDVSLIQQGLAGAVNPAVSLARCMVGYSHNNASPRTISLDRIFAQQRL